MALFKKSLYGLVIAALRSQRLGSGCGTPSVLLFKPDGIGDFILATGVIRLFERHFTGVNLVLAIWEEQEALARREFSQIARIVVPSGRDTLRSGLISGYFRAKTLFASIQPTSLISLRYHSSLFQSVILRSFRDACSYGCAPTHLSVPLHARRLVRFEPQHRFDYPAPPADGTLPRELEAHRRLAEMVLGHAVTIEEVSPQLQSFTARVGDYLLIQPFGRAAIRTYPEALLAKVLACTRLPKGSQIILCGSVGQKEDLCRLRERILLQCDCKCQVGLPDTVANLAELVANARCVLTIESAVAHIATALDKPTVIILGGGHYGHFAPWRRSERQRWLTNPVNCFHCEWNCIHKTPICIHGIPPETVAEHLQAAWYLGKAV